MSVSIQLVGNAGVILRAPDGIVLIDAFYTPIPGMAGRPAVRPDQVSAADLILVTHDHRDHFHARETAGVALRTGATVGGPRSVIRALRGTVPDRQLLELEPPVDEKAAQGERVRVGKAVVTAFGTHHGARHNSYLVELPGARLFHDGDNEDTRPLDPARLRPLDVLVFGPWQGSDWQRFVDEVGARVNLMVHLTEEETESHLQGRFLPEICDEVPERISALRAGETLDLSPARGAGMREEETP